MKLEQYLKEIEIWLKDYLEKTQAKCYVLGLSGGVDSSLVAAISKKAVGKEKLVCLALPIESHPSDVEDALKVAKQLDVNCRVIDLSKTYRQIILDLKAQDFSLLSKSNTKVRLRMVSLYAYAQNLGGLVLGTDNWDENYVGYFTKYGDGGVDLLPIVRLSKKEVREAAKIYGISDELVNRVPTAGLFAGQTDEGEMGLKYVDLDRYLLTGEADPEIKKRIEHLHKISQHKREPIPSMTSFARDK